MSELPDYDVLIWLNYNPFGEKLEKDIISSVTRSIHRYSHLDIYWFKG